jgi:hypothetical protein
MAMFSTIMLIWLLLSLGILIIGFLAQVYNLITIIPLPLSVFSLSLIFIGLFG